MVKNDSTGRDVESKGESEPVLLEASTYILGLDGRLSTDISEHVKMLLCIGNSHLGNYFWVRQRELELVGVAPVTVGQPGHREVCVIAPCLVALGPG